MRRRTGPALVRIDDFRCASRHKREHQSFASLLNNLALFFIDTARCTEAEASARAALTIFERTAGPITPLLPKCVRRRAGVRIDGEYWRISGLTSDLILY